jgi:putative transposase
MIDKGDKKLSITDQAQLLSLNRTSLYYKPVPIGDEEYRIKWFIDEIYTAHPEYGYRRITVILKRDYHILISTQKANKI